MKTENMIALIHAILFVASSGLTRANRVQRLGPGAELDAALKLVQKFYLT